MTVCKYAVQINLDGVIWFEKDCSIQDINAGFRNVSSKLDNWLAGIQTIGNLI